MPEALSNKTANKTSNKNSNKSTSNTSASKKLTLKYFALLKDERGQAEETFETAANTPKTLYIELQQQYGFTLPVNRLSVAINDTFAQWDDVLKDGDTIVFIPPVAGG